MDAIALLEDDHRMVESLFRQYEGEGDLPARRALVGRLVEELRLHGEVEEAQLFSTVAAALGKQVLADAGERMERTKRSLAARA